MKKPKLDKEPNVTLAFKVSPEVFQAYSIAAMQEGSGKKGDKSDLFLKMFDLWNEKRKG